MPLGKDIGKNIRELEADNKKKGKAKGALADLKAGMRVVVVTAGETESTAKEIQYAAAAATKQ